MAKDREVVQLDERQAKKLFERRLFPIPNLQVYQCFSVPIGERKALQSACAYYKATRGWRLYTKTQGSRVWCGRLRDK